MAYEKTEWKARKGINLKRFEKEAETPGSVILHNEPSSVTEKGTPFSVQNMNKIEQGIYDAHELIAAEEAARQNWDQIITDVIDDLIGLPEWDSDTHTLVFTTQNGATMEVDLPLEELSQGLDYDPETKEIILTKLDGTALRVSVSDLIDVYKGSIGAQIQVMVDSGNIIKAKLLAGAVGDSELADALSAKINGKADQMVLAAHVEDTDNPHGVTKTQVGLSNVTNDAQVKRSEMGFAGGVASLDNNGKVPIEQLPEAATGEYGTIQQSINAHIEKKDNPHEVTKAQVGLDNVTNDAQVKRSEMGVQNGVASLGNNGKVPIEQLPFLGNLNATWDLPTKTLTIEGARCNHNFVDGLCVYCEESCFHNFEEGVCVICGITQPEPEEEEEE